MRQTTHPLPGCPSMLRSPHPLLGLCVAIALWLSGAPAAAQAPAHVVFLVGEREYGSQRTMPRFAERLRQECGLRVTCLQSKDDELPDLDALDTADLLVMYLRFRRATDEQLARLSRWFDGGKPCVALRTTSHAFVDHQGWFPKYFGGNYKAHAPNEEGTVARVANEAIHPLLAGIPHNFDMGYGGTYNAQPLAEGAEVLLLGRTARLPAEPIAWTFPYRPGQRIFYTSLGSEEHFEQPAFERLLANAVLWSLRQDVPPLGAFTDGVTVRRGVPSPPQTAPPPTRAPSDAIVLFDGSDLDAWRHWDPSVEPRAIRIDTRADTSSGANSPDAARWPVAQRSAVARPGFGDILTRESFGNYHLHLDVWIPASSDLRPRDRNPDGFRGRSGVYLAGKHEIEIADSYGKDTNAYSFGAIHGIKAPDVAAELPAGAWQSLDIHYRHRPGGRALLSAWLNDQQIHRAVELPDRTTYGFLAPSEGEPDEAVDNRAVVTRPAAESFRLNDGNFAVAVRFRTRGDGTLVAKCPKDGAWQPQSLALFLRAGRLVYDIGWVGEMSSSERYDDGAWHRVVLTHGQAASEDGDELVTRMYVDGALAASREGFTAEHVPQHSFKIGAAATDFGGRYDGDFSDVDVYERRVAGDKAIQWTRDEVVDMGQAAFRWQPDPGAPGADAAEPQAAQTADIGIAGPIRLQADSSRVRFANIWLRPLARVDHRTLAQGTEEQQAHGASVWQAHCASCHGDAAKFAQPLAHGSDPRSMFETLTSGLTNKPAMPWLPPAARYDAIHYLRQQLALPAPDADYLAALPASLPEHPVTKAANQREFRAYSSMDYGNALHWTYEVADDNIVQKGIAVRLDVADDSSTAEDASGGIARGRAFAVYDQDTMRLAAVWTGEGFLDWRGVAFDGSHNSHAHIVGTPAFAAPNEPGWANPATGRFDDTRLIGRDGRRYGPLPRAWLRFAGRQQLAGRSVLHYCVGTTDVREQPGLEQLYGVDVFTRRFSVGPRGQDLLLRLAPVDEELAVRVHAPDTTLADPLQQDGWWLLRIPEGDRAHDFVVRMSRADPRLLRTAEARFGMPSLPAPDAAGSALWADDTVQTEARMDDAQTGFAVDEIAVPDLLKNPFASWMRFGGFDFFADGKRAAVATWNGDVWLIDGIDDTLTTIRWRRIAAGLFQPLGVRIVGDVIYVGCRDQICILEDRNGDGETDFYRCFNNDHQVTEHFHEFAMGLQTDRDGNFYYAKSARHALPALVPHHGTLLKVSKDGARTEIVANGFRAANGVCINDDGTFYVTDQEGHWTPKNRINRVVAGGFYGNMLGFHERSSSADEDMEQPLCWLTNAFDRSPAELLRVQGDRFGLPAGSLLQLSYGMGRAYLVLEDEVDGTHQGAAVTLPIPPFATGVMRGRFHEPSGQLFCCGLYGWSGARSRPGGLYRVRYVGGELRMPTAMHVVAGGLELTFGAKLDAELARDAESYSLRSWSLRRTKRYGSDHHDEQDLQVKAATLLPDGQTVRLSIPGLKPTMCLEVACDLETAGGERLRCTIHGTVHRVR
ncbi:MAG: DUF6797 domain-containing protein [Planctomycetota bacterium]